MSDQRYNLQAASKRARSIAFARKLDKQLGPFCKHSLRVSKCDKCKGSK